MRRYKQRNPKGAEKFMLTIHKAGRLIILILVATAISLRSSSQEKKLEYQVKRNGNVVGNVWFTQLIRKQDNI